MTRLLLFTLALATGGYALQEPQTAKEPPKPTGFGAVSYFEAKCARCHGPQGSYLTAGFAKDKDDVALTAVTKQMAEGPGGAPLEDKDLRIEVAYMRAISEGKPFLEWVKDTGKTEGESSVAKLEATIDGTKTVIEAEEGVWKIAKGQKTLLEAGEGDKAVHLDLQVSNISQSLDRN